LCGVTFVCFGKLVKDEHGAFLNKRRTPTTPDFGVWVKGKQGSKEGTFLG
jgi:hypothetical protein